MNDGYLDFNATTPMSKAATEAHVRALSMFANPSANYRTGKESKEAIACARRQIAELLGAQADEIAFTSGGTEANNWALKGSVDALTDLSRNEPMHIVASAIEHASVLETLAYLERYRGVQLTLVRPDAQGLMDPQSVVGALQPNTRLVSVMLANNEIGTIQPIAGIANMLKQRDIRLHVDAVQAVGKVPVDVKALGVDTLAFSAHKFHGPKGLGGLYMREGLPLEPLLHGGGQEQGRRAGTESVAAIIAAGVAARECKQHLSMAAAHVQAHRDALRHALCNRFPTLVVHGGTLSSTLLPNTLSVQFTGQRAEALAALLDLVYGFQVSLASACGNNKQGSLSHVLRAMGLSDDDIRSTVRISLGDNTSAEQVDRFVEAMATAVDLLDSIAKEGHHATHAITPDR
jgi:cysteine desulfurase